MLFLHGREVKWVSRPTDGLLDAEQKGVIITILYVYIRDNDTAGK